MKNVIKPLAKGALIPLGLTAAAAVADARIHKKNLRLWNNNTNNIKIVKVVKHPEGSGLLLKGISHTIQNEAKQPNFLVCYYVH